MGEILYSILAGLCLIIPGVIMYLLIDKEEKREVSGISDKEDNEA